MVALQHKVDRKRPAVPPIERPSASAPSRGLTLPAVVPQHAAPVATQRRVRALQAAREQQRLYHEEARLLEEMLQRRPDLMMEPRALAAAGGLHKLGSGSFACVWSLPWSELHAPAALRRQADRAGYGSDGGFRPPTRDQQAAIESIRSISISALTTSTAAPTPDSTPQACLKVLQLPMGTKEARYWPTAGQAAYDTLSHLSEAQLDVRHTAVHDACCFAGLHRLHCWLSCTCTFADTGYHMPSLAGRI